MAQAGLRHALLPERLALDAGLGRRIGGGESYVTIGLTLSEPVLR